MANSSRRDREKPKKPLTYAQKNEWLLERLLARIAQAEKIKRKRTSMQ
jgi:hypothetical protein